MNLYQQPENFSKGFTLITFCWTHFITSRSQDKNDISLYKNLVIIILLY